MSGFASLGRGGGRDIFRVRFSSGGGNSAKGGTDVTANFREARFCTPDKVN